MKYLSRNKVYLKVALNKNAKKIYILCEGSETEIRYFKYFQGLSSNIDIIPIPNVNGQSDPVKLKENSELLFIGNSLTPPIYSLSQDYKDEVWFVIDTDRWNEGNKINQLKTFCNSKNIESKQWFVAQSNPSFEIWFYFHFFEKKPISSEVEKHLTFKQFINNVIPGGFDSRSMPIEIENAIINAKNNFEITDNQPRLYSTEVFYLGENIFPFVKIQIEKAKEMMSNM